MRRSEGNAVVGTDDARQAAFVGQALKSGEREFFPIGFQRLTQKQVAGGVVGDRQRITISFIAELKLSLVVGAPEIIGMQTVGQKRAFGSTAAPPHGLDQRREQNSEGKEGWLRWSENLVPIARAPERPQ